LIFLRAPSSSITGNGSTRSLIGAPEDFSFSAGDLPSIHTLSKMGPQVIPGVLPPLGPLEECKRVFTPLGMYHEGGLIILTMGILHDPEQVFDPWGYGAVFGSFREVMEGAFQGPVDGISGDGEDPGSP